MSTTPPAHEEETVASSPYLRRAATTEGRAEFVKHLQAQASAAATSSRDFGRGYMQAVRDLAAAPVRCSCCDLHAPHVKQGELYACKDCGSVWKRSASGWLSSPGGTPVALEVA